MDPHQQGMHQANGTGMDPNYHFVPVQQGEKGQAMAAQQQPGYAPYQDGQYQHPDPQYQHQQYPAEYGSAPPSGYPPAESGYPAANNVRPPVLGMKRGTFLAVVGLIALLLALVIGLGAGLGVSQNKLHDKENELAAIQSSLSPSATVATQTPTATQTSASASATPQFVNECPKSNNTVYTASTGGKEFRKFCGIDYGKGEADDLANVKVKSMDDCIDACAAKTSCEGAGWGLIQGDQGDLHSCWMKTNLTSKHHEADAGWNFAVLIQSEG